MKNPKVSVLMPIYKTNEKYLRKAIESILNQTFGDFEFLIVDDCPKDNREKVVKSYKDKRICYIQNNKNIGISSSRNKLLKMAKGKYLAVMDHDDISMPERFEKEVQFLDTHPDVGVVGCWYTRIVNHERNTYPVENGKIIKGMVKGECCILHPASMIRKSVLLDNHLYYEGAYSPCEDFMLWARLIAYTKFYNLPEFLFQYRDHQENTSHKQELNMSIATQKVISFLQTQYPHLSGRRKIYFPCKYFPLICFKLRDDKKEVRLLNWIPILTIKNKRNGKILIKILTIPLPQIRRKIR